MQRSKSFVLTITKKAEMNFSAFSHYHYWHSHHILLIAVFACIIGPLVEELFFRQTLLRYLRKSLPTWLSIFIASLAFALTHMHNLSLSEWVGAVGYLGGGLAFSIIYVKEKENIYYPLLVHILGNSLSFIILALS